MKIYIAVFELIDPQSGFIVPLSMQFARTPDKALGQLKTDLYKNKDIPDWVERASRHFLGVSFRKQNFEKAMNDVKVYKYKKTKEKTPIFIGEFFHAAIYEDSV